ncbi:MAG: glycosyltransferase [Hyphomonas sp.]|nr:glycosyltransferase [Hyphomonas sp.]
MKVAFFVNAFPMMSEAFIANSAMALLDAGHSVDIFGIGNAAPSGLSVPEAARYGLEAHTTNMSWPEGILQRWLQLPGALNDVARQHGAGALTRLSPKTYRRTFADLSAIYQARDLPTDGDYDILHCQFATLAEHVLKHRRAGFLKGRVVVNFRGYDISEVVQSQGRGVYDHVWPEADGYIANCEYFRQRAIDLGCPEDRIRVVGSGIRLESFPFRPKAHDPREELRFLMVGRLIERKGFHIALQALGRYARASRRRIRIDIVGDGPMRDRLQQLAQDCGLGSRTTFHGAQDHAAIAGFLTRCDVFLAPCMTCPKGGQDAPVNTIKEAMAIGRPVVATRHGGIPELVYDGVTGALCEEGNVENLEAAIHRLMDLAPSWPGMLAAGRRAVEQAYELSRTTGQLMQAYQSILQPAGALSVPIPTPEMEAA